MGSYKCCICFTRKFRWNEAQPPSDVKSAFSDFTDGGPHMTSDQFRRFLAESQGDVDVAADEADRIMDQIRQLRQRLLIGKMAKSPIGLEDFHHYLFNDELNPSLRSQIINKDLSFF